MAMTSPSEEPAPEERAPARLHRSATERVYFGVCGGIADYLGVDPALVRVAFVVATLWGGLGLVLYVVLAVILPVDENTSVLSARITPERSHMLAGVALIVLGSLLLVSNLGLVPWLSWNLVWPLMAIIIGVALLMRPPRRMGV